MMYRLNPEAVPFFSENIKTLITDWETWTETYNVDKKALEEVKPCYLKYGHEYTIKTDDGRDLRTGTMGGWDKTEPNSILHCASQAPNSTNMTSSQKATS